MIATVTTYNSVLSPSGVRDPHGRRIHVRRAALVIVLCPLLLWPCGNPADREEGAGDIAFVVSSGLAAAAGAARAAPRGQLPPVYQIVGGRQS